MLNIAVRAARRAGTIILRSQARMDTVKVDLKGRRDYVSTTDKEAEAAIMEILLKAYPSHAILAEESGGHGDSDHVWIIDPLDGTTNYLHGFPHFAVSIALQVKGQVELGLIYDPLRDELFTATRGGGALLNDRRLRVARGRDRGVLRLGRTRHAEYAESQPALRRRNRPRFRAVRVAPVPRRGYPDDGVGRELRADVHGRARR